MEFCLSRIKQGKAITLKTESINLCALMFKNSVIHSKKMFILHRELFLCNSQILQNHDRKREMCFSILQLENILFLNCYLDIQTETEVFLKVGKEN